MPFGPLLLLPNLDENPRTEPICLISKSESLPETLLIYLTVIILSLSDMEHEKLNRRVLFLFMSFCVPLHSLLTSIDER